MSASILAKLKVKPIPIPKKEINIGLAKPIAPAKAEPVAITTVVVDRTKDSAIDRQELLKRFRAKSVVQDKTIKEVPEVTVPTAAAIIEEPKLTPTLSVISKKEE